MPDGTPPVLPADPTAADAKSYHVKLAWKAATDDRGVASYHVYRGTDAEVTEALKGYVYFKDDARFGGWEAYLQRSDDFVRFCCHKHIAEMLAARGGSRKTRVVWRWPDNR